jgi:hypothetical protein
VNLFRAALAELVKVLVGEGSVEGWKDAVGVAIEGLPRKALLLGLSGDSAVGPSRTPAALAMRSWG